MAQRGSAGDYLAAGLAVMTPCARCCSSKLPRRPAPAASAGSGLAALPPYLAADSHRVSVRRAALSNGRRTQRTAGLLHGRLHEDAFSCHGISSSTRTATFGGLAR